MKISKSQLKKLVEEVISEDRDSLDNTAILSSIRTAMEIAFPGKPNHFVTDKIIGVLSKLDDDKFEKLRQQVIELDRTRKEADKYLSNLKSDTGKILKFLKLQ